MINSLWKQWKQQWEIQIMVVPGIVCILIFSYIPMYGVLMAFQDYNIFEGFFRSPWVGMKHFVAFFHAPEFWRIIRNTIAISLLKLIVGFPAPIILALMLNEIRNMMFKRVIQTVSYLPYFISWAIVSGFAIQLLAVDNGNVNFLLMSFHIVDDPINFLSIPQYFWGILVSINVWKEVGFASIIYLAAISGIDPHLYEAASIDGA